MKVTFVYPSEIELDDTIQYYNNQISGLGDQFYKEIIRSIELICKFPEAWRKIGKRTRRGVVKRFPYLLLYIIDGGEILITCIAHQHRSPQHYKDRIE